MNTIQEELEKLEIKQLLGRYPFLNSYLSAQGLELTGDETATIPALLAELDPDEIEDKALDTTAIIGGTVRYIEQMMQFLGDGTDRTVTEITLFPGTDKHGLPENFENLTFQAGRDSMHRRPNGIRQEQAARRY